MNEVKEYQFSIRLQGSFDNDVLIEKLAPHCNDALLAIGKKGAIVFKFTVRSNKGLAWCIEDALMRIRRAIEHEAIIEKVEVWTDV